MQPLGVALRSRRSTRAMKTKAERLTTTKGDLTIPIILLTIYAPCMARSEIVEDQNSSY